MTLSLGTTAGAKSNGAQAGDIHAKVKSAETFRVEKGDGGLGGVRIIWLHQDPSAYAGPSPVYFLKKKSSMVVCKTRGRGDGKL